jgi:NhaP-type Na+/H+ and K+/H+ antiporter
LDLGCSHRCGDSFVREYRSSSIRLDWRFYGGVLRDGPSMEYQQVGSLGEGDWIDVLESTAQSRCLNNLAKAKRLKP